MIYTLPSSLHAISEAFWGSLELVSLWGSGGPVLWVSSLLSLTSFIMTSDIEDVYSYNFPRDDKYFKSLGMQIPYNASCFILTYIL